MENDETQFSGVRKLQLRKSKENDTDAEYDIINE